MRQGGIDFTLRTNYVNYILDGNTMMFFLRFKHKTKHIQNVFPNCILKMGSPKINDDEETTRFVCMFCSYIYIFMDLHTF